VKTVPMVHVVDAWLGAVMLLLTVLHWYKYIALPDKFGWVDPFFLVLYPAWVVFLLWPRKVEIRQCW
jgi:hypothetical protein